MRFALSIMALVLGSSPAFAQFADVHGPDRVTIATPFRVDVVMVCPPPSEAPPPRNCRGTTSVSFSVSDRSASFPKGYVVLAPNDAQSVGPFVFHRPGLQMIELFDPESQFIGAFSFVVQTPAGTKSGR